VTNPYYSSEQTEHSRAVLGEVLAAVPGAILIGGWGTWVRAGGPTSHDIDLIVSRAELAVLRGMVDDLSQSHHLAGTTWRASWRSIHLDLYVPRQSRLGANLQLRVEQLLPYAETVRSYRVLTLAAHTATKMAALLDRPNSLPGHKDRGEILRLLDDPASSQAPSVIGKASVRTPSQLRQLLHTTFEILVAEPALTRQGRARLRQLEATWLQSLPEVERSAHGLEVDQSVDLKTFHSRLAP
jgi:hypothetical protein